jgi:enoyl-CoA hydratase/carnithine racemase
MSAAPSGPLRVDFSGDGRGAAHATATITLADPQRRNALGHAMFDALERALADIASRCGVAAQDGAGAVHDHATTGAARDEAAHDHAPSDAPRVVVLRAEGTAFCAGFDLRAVADDRDAAQPVLAGFLRRLHGCVGALRRLPAVTIAAVQGPALAGGCALVSACDFVVASAEARFGYPTHAIGLSPAVSAPTLASRMGAGAARELLMGGHLIDGARALELGLASHLAPRSVDETAAALAAILLEKGPVALRATKRWLRELDGAEAPAWRDTALAASLAGVGGPESRERVASTWARHGGTPAAP